ncbi:hypothetical protein WDZ16_11570 [Pseudokineococcus marinus]|nr:hypothetical protein [Pseudokineococcus marinus]
MPAPAPALAPARDESTLLQDAAAARSWGAVDRRRDPRRRHR